MLWNIFVYMAERERKRAREKERERATERLRNLNYRLPMGNQRRQLVADRRVVLDGELPFRYRIGGVANYPLWDLHFRIVEYGDSSHLSDQVAMFAERRRFY